MVELYEKLGLFYLGRDIDKTTQEATDALTLLKNKKKQKLYDSRCHHWYDRFGKNWFGYWSH